MTLTRIFKNNFNFMKHLSCAGIVLEAAISDFQTIALYQPAVNGLAGNLVGIYSSTLSTTLHRTGGLGSWSNWAPKKFYLYPIEAFVGARSMFSVTTKENFENRNFI